MAGSANLGCCLGVIHHHLPDTEYSLYGWSQELQSSLFFSVLIGLGIVFLLPKIAEPPVCQFVVMDS